MSIEGPVQCPTSVSVVARKIGSIAHDQRKLRGGAVRFNWSEQKWGSAGTELVSMVGGIAFSAGVVFFAYAAADVIRKCDLSLALADPEFWNAAFQYTMPHCLLVLAGSFWMLAARLTRTGKHMLATALLLVGLAIALPYPNTIVSPKSLSKWEVTSGMALPNHR